MLSAEPTGSWNDRRARTQRTGPRTAKRLRRQPRIRTRCSGPNADPQLRASRARPSAVAGASASAPWAACSCDLCGGPLPPQQAQPSGAHHLSVCNTTATAHPSIARPPRHLRSSPQGAARAEAHVEGASMPAWAHVRSNALQSYRAQAVYAFATVSCIERAHAHTDIRTCCWPLSWRRCLLGLCTRG